MTRALHFAVHAPPSGAGAGTTLYRGARDAGTESSGGTALPAIRDSRKSRVALVVAALRCRKRGKNQMVAPPRSMATQLTGARRTICPPSSRSTSSAERRMRSDLKCRYGCPTHLRYQALRV